MFNYLFLIVLISLLYFWNIITNIIYNFLYLYKSFYLIKKIYNNNLDFDTINNYKIIVIKTGVFAIKMVQWGLNRFKLMTDDKLTENILITVAGPIYLVLFLILLCCGRQTILRVALVILITTFVAFMSGFLCGANLKMVAQTLKDS